MKKPLLLALLFLISLSSFGQKIKFSDSTNQWKVFYHYCGDNRLGSSWTLHSYIGDTEYHGMKYKILSDAYGSGFNSFIREDTIIKKVFTISLIHDNDTIEKVLYDYTLNVGDTFKTAVSVHYVSSIDSVIINSKWHKIFDFFPVSCSGCSTGWGPREYIVIEGIGSLNSPVFPIDAIGFEGCITLTCFNNQGSTPSLSHLAGSYFNNTSSCGLTFGEDVKNINFQTEIAFVTPNPIIESSKIQLPHSIPSITLTITNTLGQIVAQIPFQNKQELPIGDLVKSPGIYFYRVKDNGSGEIFSGKFVY